MAKILDSTAVRYADQLADIQAAGIMDEQLAAYFTDSTKQPQAAEVVMLVANLYQYEVGQQ